MVSSLSLFTKRGLKISDQDGDGWWLAFNGGKQLSAKSIFGSALHGDHGKV